MDEAKQSEPTVFRMTDADGNGLFVTKDGAVGIDINGTVRIRSIAAWASAEREACSLIAATREQVIEECAKACELEGWPTAYECAAAIRALTRPPGE